LEKSDARIDGAITSGRETKEADIGAVFRKLFRMRERRFFGLTCESPGGNARGKNLPPSGTNCRSEAMFRNRESDHITGFFAMARRLLTSMKVTFKACLFGA
jgi:hypothetical protein